MNRLSEQLYVFLSTLPALPDGFQLGGFPVPMLLLTAAAGYLVVSVWAPRRAIRFGSTAERVDGLVNLLLVAGLVGSRLVYVIRDPGGVLSSPILLLTGRGPLTIWGALLGAGIALGWLLLRERAATVASTDAAALPLLLAFALAAFGWSGGATTATAGFGLILASLLAWAEKGRRTTGQASLGALVASTLWLVIAEALGDPQPLLLGLGEVQLLALAGAALGLHWIDRLGRGARGEMRT